MPDVTINVPSINTEAYFKFKEPINYYLRNKHNLNSLSMKLKVVSIVSMKDMIRNYLRDPYKEIYAPAGISEVEYKKDLLDNIPIVSFSYHDYKGVEKYILSPLNYIESISSVSNKEYINKLIVIDLNKLPKEFDTTIFFTDLADFIESRIGIRPEIKEVAVGKIELISQEEHEMRETIRTNMVTVHKTLKTQLEEANLRYDQVLQRLQVLGISLG